MTEPAMKAAIPTRAMNTSKPWKRIRSKLPLFTAKSIASALANISCGPLLINSSIEELSFPFSVWEMQRFNQSRRSFF